jgi:DNA polymerase III epsilon subunit-like protein
MDFIWMSIDFETIDDFSLKLFCKTDAIQIGVVVYNNNEVIDKWSSYIKPQHKFNFAHTSKIKFSDVQNSPTLDDLQQKLEYLLNISNYVVVHNYPTEFGVLRELFPNLTIRFLDTLYTSRRNFKEVKGHSLSECCKRFNINNDNAHDALDDAIMCGELAIAMKNINAEPYYVVVEKGIVVTSGGNIKKQKETSEKN